MMKKIYTLILIGIFAKNISFSYAQTTLCLGQNIHVSTSTYTTGGDYEQFYVLVDNADDILAVNNTGTFTGLAAGNYFVYAVNTNEQMVKDELLDFGLWSEVANMSASHCMDVLAPQVFVIVDLATPIFTARDTVCQGDFMPLLPVISNNNIQGSWSPTLNNLTTTTYTFTPNVDQCAVSSSMKIVIKEHVSPVFNAVGPFCQGAVILDLPTISINGFSGTWSPVINNLATTTYTFSPSVGTCIHSTDLIINILSDCLELCENQNIVVSSSGYTVGNQYEQLYVLVNEGGVIVESNLSGTFASPAVGTYHVYAVNTNDAFFKNLIANSLLWTDVHSQANIYCSDIIGPKIFTIVPNVIPVFDTILPQCQNAILLPLPLVSNNSLSGTWSPGLNNTSTTTYTFMPNAGVCATSISKTIEILPIVSSISDLSICQNQLPYAWNGLIFNGAASQTATLIASNGCDSLATLNLSILPILSSVTDLSICQNQLPYTWNGLIFNGAASQTATLIAANGCDSLATLNLSILPILSSVTDLSICQNQLPYTWNGLIFNGAASQTATLIASNGCDSLATLNLSILPILSSVTDLSICQNQLPYTWNGLIFNGAASQTATLIASNGCDSLATLNLSILPILSSVTDLSICQNQLPYAWNGLIFNGAASQTATLIASNGCDSLATLNLSILPILSSVTDLSICQNQLPYAWNGLIFNGAASQTATLIASNGCDSLATLNLNVIENFNAQWNSPSSFCENGAVVDLNTMLLPESSTGGVWSGTNVSGHYFSPSGLNGNYSITYQVGTGVCSVSQTHNVEVLALGNASWTPPVKICASNDPVNLNQFVTGDLGGTWEGNGVQGSMWYTHPLEGNFEVSYTVGNENCQSTLSHSIIIISQDIKFHNAFSPNGDGINDFWTVKNIENHPDNQLIIVNRWGGEVYRKERYLNDWDGSNLNEGTYFYFMDVNVCDNKKKFSGYITIIR